MRTQLEATPWWNNQSLASSVAVASGASNPSSVVNGFGPLFAFSTTGENVRFQRYMIGKGLASSGQRDFGLEGRFALGSAVPASPAAVPEPLTILGSITAAGFGVAFKRKKNSTKEE